MRIVLIRYCSTPHKQMFKMCVTVDLVTFPIRRRFSHIYEGTVELVTAAITYVITGNNLYFWMLLNY